MQFLYHEEAGKEKLLLKKEQFPHLFKVRRLKSNTKLNLRNMMDFNLYMYSIESLEKKYATLILDEVHMQRVEANKNLTLGWSIIDPKIIEKTLPSLNEMGVKKIVFIYSDFSQKNYKLDFERFRRIIINSSQQCGRSNLLEFDIYENINTFLLNYKDTCIIDFSEKLFSDIKNTPQSILVGSEGGFSPRERELFNKENVFGFDSPLILRSESAIQAISAKILL